MDSFTTFAIVASAPPVAAPLTSSVSDDTLPEISDFEKGGNGGYAYCVIA